MTDVAKPLIRYEAKSLQVLGERGNQVALLVPLDHPSIENNKLSMTSKIKFHDEFRGILETQNSVYVPVDNSKEEECK